MKSVIALGLLACSGLSQAAPNVWFGELTEEHSAFIHGIGIKANKHKTTSVKFMVDFDKCEAIIGSFRFTNTVCPEGGKELAGVHLETDGPVGSRSIHVEKWSGGVSVAFGYTTANYNTTQRFTGYN